MKRTATLNTPKSFFWLSDNRTVGFRIVRPLTVPEVEELARRWNPGTEHDAPLQHYRPNR
jgi:hypothetical protein